MKLNYLIFNKITKLVICILFTTNLLAQVDTDVDVSKIKEKQSVNGKYTPYIPDVKHPVSIFSNEFSIEDVKANLIDEFDFKS